MFTRAAAGSGVKTVPCWSRVAEASYLVAQCYHEVLCSLYPLSAQVHAARRIRDGCLQPEPRAHFSGVRELFLQSTPGCFLFNS